MSTTAFDISSSLIDVVETTLKDGPQVVTKDGTEATVLISINDWKVIKANKSKWRLPSDPPAENLVDVLLDPNGPHDIYIPPRGKHRRRPPFKFED
ncbi:type II toxin-antitoxin system prevent-host-death family antitoxin [Terracidiphilus gabretensis]|jgi:antitoxin Phd|uniref:type II toxin-antitoxin system prevent-host-death family antitoxin n=1 Tax=Terracidiphilus gabretensis TaxID=1577687 RepID=UPI00071B4A1A|nr:type II toxin-antitoxin system prevent-host-death family antitoxin [Terracidiphilus gabretensis]